MFAQELAGVRIESAVQGFRLRAGGSLRTLCLNLAGGASDLGRATRGMASLRRHSRSASSLGRPRSNWPGRPRAMPSPGAGSDAHSRAGEVAWRLRRLLLGGAGPLQAGITQVLVLIGLLAAAAISALVTVQLVAAGLVSRVAPRDVRYR